MQATTLLPLQRTPSPTDSLLFQLQDIVKIDMKDEFVKYLKHKPECINMMHNDGKSLLMVLIIAQAEKCALYLLDTPKLDIFHKDAKGRTAFHHACASGNAALVQMLLAKGASIYDKDQDGWTPIHYAVFHDRIDIITLIQGAHFCSPLASRIGEVFQEHTLTPLHLAASGSIRCFEKVAHLGQLYLNVPDPMGMTPLHRAAGNQSDDITNKLLEMGALVNPSDRQGRTPLAIACQKGKAANAKKLLEHKADPNKGTSHPLLHAYLNGNVELATELLRRGAQPNVSFEKNTLLEIVVALGDQQFADLLIRAGANKTPHYLALCAFKGQKRGSYHLTHGRNTMPRVDTFTEADLKARKHLEQPNTGFDQNTYLHELVLKETINFELLVSLTKKEDWEVKNIHGETPFLYCCRKGSLECCLRLLDLPFINVGARNKTQDTALHLALSYKNMLVFYFLVSLCKLPVNDQNSEGRTVLHMAVLQGIRTAVEILLKFNADPSMPDASGNTALHLISDTKAQEPVQVAAIIDQLIVKKANLEALNQKLKSPLLYAWKQKNSLTFTLLLEGGSNPDSVCKAKTALIKACKKNNYNAAEQLILAGAMRDLKAGTTALISSIRASNLKIVALLFSKTIGCGQKKSKIASPNTAFDHETPLSVAIEKIADRVKANSIPEEAIPTLDEFKIFQILLEVGAKVDTEIKCPNKINQTPLTLATQYRLRPVVQALLAKKAKVDNKPKGNVKPLRIACLNGYAAIAEDLIQAGATISVKLIRDTKHSQEVQALFKRYQETKFTKANSSHIVGKDKSKSSATNNLLFSDEDERSYDTVSKLSSSSGNGTPSSGSGQSSNNITPRSNTSSTSQSPRNAENISNGCPVFTADEISKLMEALSSASNEVSPKKSH